MRAAVIVFPGSNCDLDARTALEAMTSGHWGSELAGGTVMPAWHGDTSLPKVDLVVLPGGFSYGDYLRCGAISARSPIMRAITDHANRGGYVLGICNGFQILTESGLLPGALMRNQQLRFICRDSYLRVEQSGSAFTNTLATSQVIRLPVAHHDGNYRIDADGLKRLEDNNRIAFRYCHRDGSIDDQANINGSAGNIAGILNEHGNILGMMPHPERACDAQTGGTDGRSVFRSLATHL